MAEQRGRLGVDIGGTFTDVALEVGGRRYSAKILTTPEAPERAVLEALHVVLREAALTPAEKNAPELVDFTTTTCEPGKMVPPMAPDEVPQRVKAA